MMTKTEFINHAIGKPWVSRATGPQAYDCWGLVIASFLEIEGLELPIVNGYAYSAGSPNEIESELRNKGRFIKSTGIEGDIVSMYNSVGDFEHVGRIICGGIVHAWGQGGNGTGQVKWNTIAAMRKLYPRLEFERYAVNC
jgi:hypothetical protein